MKRIAVIAFLALAILALVFIIRCGVMCLLTALCFH